MAHLSSLRSLKLSDCKLLECVAKLPPHLNKVLAFDCPSIKRMMLNSRFDFEKGQCSSVFQELQFLIGSLNVARDIQ
ncbi:NBS-LRR resistance-like protein [Trifolium medium]|uniref:NBS-LRR resistance-like protein n=1 Tax=Trifolium medium TaxID=97028 RepID=A0A392MWI6_9FABA|nr:NBS-LRR resistance-like protein [Trifolium medium]